MGTARGVDMTLLADVLPVAETVIIDQLNDRDDGEMGGEDG